MKNSLGFFAAMFLLAGCAGQNRDLSTLGKQLDAYVNAHDLNGFASNLADDAVAKGPDGHIYTGKDSVKAWIGALAPGFHVDSWGWQTSGDTLTWISSVHSDVFAAMGVNPIISNTMAVFSGDKIRYFQSTLARESAGKMRFIQFYAEVVNGGNSDAVDKYVAADMVEHQLLPPGTPTGAEGVKGLFKMIHEAFPDLHGTPFLVLAEGDVVTVAATWEGTNKGKFMGKPASNKKMSWTVVDIIRLVDGKAVEHWGWDDMAERMAHH